MEMNTEKGTDSLRQSLINHSWGKQDKAVEKELLRNARRLQWTSQLQRSEAPAGTRGQHCGAASQDARVTVCEGTWKKQQKTPKCSGPSHQRGGIQIEFQAPSFSHTVPALGVTVCVWGAVNQWREDQAFSLCHSAFRQTLRSVFQTKEERKAEGTLHRDSGGLAKCQVQSMFRRSAPQFSSHWDTC